VKQLRVSATLCLVALALSACSHHGASTRAQADGALVIGEQELTTCAPTPASGTSTIGATVVTAKQDVTVTGVELVDASNLDVVGTYVLPPTAFVGSALEFDPPNDSTNNVRSGEDVYVETGFKLKNNAEPGTAKSLRVTYRTQDGRPGTVAAKSTIWLVPAGQSCDDIHWQK